MRYAVLCRAVILCCGVLRCAVVCFGDSVGDKGGVFLGAEEVSCLRFGMKTAWLVGECGEMGTICRWGGTKWG